MGVQGRKNVIIIGAGASAEYNFPTGEGLKSKIAMLTETTDKNDFKTDFRNREFSIAINQLRSKHEYESLLEAAEAIRVNIIQAPSIDNFLHTHANNQAIVDVGKLAIATAIFEAEKSSYLFVDNKKSSRLFNDNNYLKGWLTGLFKILVSERNFEQFLQALKDITFISFNYDRCIHQFFYYQSTSYFQLSSSESESVIIALNIIFPYGSIGDFRHYRNNYTNFGKIENGSNLLSLSESIKTFSEQIESEISNKIHQAVCDADVALFIGFAFHKQNRELLFSSKEGIQKDCVYATVYGERNNAVNRFQEILSTTFSSKDNSLLGERKLQLADMTCSEFFDEFKHQLLE